MKVEDLEWMKTVVEDRKFFCRIPACVILFGIIYQMLVFHQFSWPIFIFGILLSLGWIVGMLSALYLQFAILSIRLLYEMSVGGDSENIIALILLICFVTAYIRTRWLEDDIYEYENNIEFQEVKNV